MNHHKQLQFETNDLIRDLYGAQNRNIKRLEAVSGVHVHTRGNIATLSGKREKVEKAYRVLEQLYALIKQGHMIQIRDVDQAFDLVTESGGKAVERVYSDSIPLNGGMQKFVSPKSAAQRAYIKAIGKNDIVFGIGPAGTGKTYLAIAMAVTHYLNKSVERIILTRPAVEAGEKLGFLPGSLTEKVDPYLRPLYDALHDMMSGDKVTRLMERNEIEVAPLAFMRGRTLNNAFIILDEAQNTTPEQMKMFLTRLGMSSKAVITGDVTQIDLPIGKASGLVQAQSLLGDIKGISFCPFSHKDVVRHRLVKEIIKAYESL